MNKAEFESLQTELKRNRTQSYVFLGLLIAGVLATAYAFHELKHAKDEIQDKNELLKEQKEDIKSKNLKLEELNNQLYKLDSIQGELNAVDQEKRQKQTLIKKIFDIVNKTNSSEDVSNLSTLSVAGLEKKVATLEAGAVRYDQARIAAIKSLFSPSESKRKAARSTLLKNYSTDPLVIPNFLAESQGKVNLKNQSTYYQFIYLLTQLDGDVLKPNSKALLAFFETGEKAGLNGSRTKSDINSIKRKMK